MASYYNVEKESRVLSMMTTMMHMTDFWMMRMPGRIINHIRGGKTNGEEIHNRD